MADVDERYERLVSTVSELLALLRTYDVQWADSIEGIRDRLARRDVDAASALLGTYGGMGSFNDVVIHPMNGHAVAPASVFEVNDRFDELRGSAYREAQDLVYELRRQR